MGYIKENHKAKKNNCVGYEIITTQFDMFAS